MPLVLHRFLTVCCRRSAGGLLWREREPRQRRADSLALVRLGRFPNELRNDGDDSGNCRNPGLTRLRSKIRYRVGLTVPGKEAKIQGNLQGKHARDERGNEGDPTGGGPVHGQLKYGPRGTRRFGAYRRHGPLRIIETDDPSQGQAA